MLFRIIVYLSFNKITQLKHNEFPKNKLLLYYDVSELKQKEHVKAMDLFIMELQNNKIIV